MYPTDTPTVRPLRLAAGLLLGATLFVSAASACSSPIARVDVYDRTDGRALETYPHRGRQFVVGRPGNEYAIRIRNCSNRRVLAVVSVDGVNVITGDAAAPDQSGYVIEPYGYVTIEGWRKDLERTAAFYFTDPGDSYAARTGRPDDLGVIGVALFREREHEPRAERQAAKTWRTKPTRLRRRHSVPATVAASGRPRSEWRSNGQAATPTSVSRSATSGARISSRWACCPTHGRPWREPDPFPGALGFVPDP